MVKIVQELLLSRDIDNIAIATEILKTYPTFIDITFHPLLNLYYSQFENLCDGTMIGDSHGDSIINSLNYGNGNYLYVKGCGASGYTSGGGNSSTR
jgi:hypothetical protein